MPQIDLLLAAELVVVLLLVATMDATPHRWGRRSRQWSQGCPCSGLPRPTFMPSASCGWRGVGSFDVTHCAIAADLLP